MHGQCLRNITETFKKRLENVDDNVKYAGWFLFVYWDFKKVGIKEERNERYINS